MHWRILQSGLTRHTHKNQVVLFVLLLLALFFFLLLLLSLAYSKSIPGLYDSGYTRRRWFRPTQALKTLFVGGDIYIYIYIYVDFVM